MSTSSSNTAESVQVPQRVYYGWVMLPIAMLGLIATSPGQTYGVSVFTEPMRKALSLSHGQMAAAYTLGSLLGALPIVFFGRMMDRHGLKRTLAVSVLLFSGACCIAAASSNWLSLFISFFLLRLLGPGVIAMLCSNTLPFWFHRRLGTVEGIRQVGVASSMVLIPTLFLSLYETLGWRNSYLVLGAGVSALMLPLVIFLYHNSPEDIGQQLDGTFEPQGSQLQQAEAFKRDSFTVGEALASRSYWIVASGTALFGMIQTGIFFSIVAIVQDRGYSETLAVEFLSRFAICMAVMQLIGGVLSDRFPARGLLLVSLMGFALSMGILWKGQSASAVLWSGLVMGASQGGYLGVSNPLWARYFGRAALGRIRGTLMTILVASSSLGPLLIGLCRDWTGSYAWALAMFTLIPLPLSVVMLWATPPQRPRENVSTSSNQVLTTA